MMQKDHASLLVLLIVFCPGLSAPLEAQLCEGVDQLQNHSDKGIRLRNDALLFSTNILKIDIDGSKRSYGVHDHGVENICNGLSPISPARCQNVVQQGSCYTHCKQKFREWHDNGHDPAKLGDYMRAIGLGGANGSVPRVQLQDPPHEDMFVSHTSVRYGPWERGQSTAKIEAQESQIEAFEVPFFVIPGSFRSLPWDATPGDIGVAVHAQDPSRYALFVVGDVGGNLDEGSAKLQELLKGEALEPVYKANVLGERVARFGDISLTKYAEGQELDLRIAIFRHTSSYDRRKSGSLIVLQDVSDQQQLLEKIQSVGQRKLAQFGGPEEVVRCTKGL